MFKQPLMLTALAAAVLATGCSSGSSSGADSGNNTSTTSLTGKVADGYLQNARVCLDLNTNGACDTGEPSTLSAMGGAFTLQGVTQAQIDTFPLVVEIVVGETIDEDNPGEAITRAYTLTAPAGSVFVSPLTTMIQNEIQENGLSAEEARASIQARLGTDIDPSADYVAGSVGDTNADEYGRLYRVAQLTRAVMQENQELIEAIAGETDLDPADLLAIIINRVLEALEEIQDVAENNSGEGFDPDALLQNGSLNGAVLGESDIEDQVQQREDINNATSANLATAVATGLYYFEEDDEDFSYGAVESEEGEIAETYFEYTQTQDSFPDYVWNLVPDSVVEEDCYLTTTGWSCVGTDTETITTSGNNLRVLRGELANTEEIITGVEVNVADKSLKAYLPGFEKVLAPRATFSEGATAYRLTATRTNTQYRLFKSAPVASEFEGPMPFAAGDRCPDGGTVGTNPGNFTDDGWCNNVFSPISGEIPGDGEGVPLTTLAGMISETPLEAPESIRQFMFWIFGEDNDEFETGAWGLELLADGTANYWTGGFIAETEQYGFYIAHVSTWSYQTVNNQELLVLNFPAAVRAQGGFDADLQGYVYAVVDNYVRSGEILKSGTVPEQQWVFNATAKDDILAAFRYDALYDLEADTGYDVEVATVEDYEYTAGYDIEPDNFPNNILAGFSFADDDGVFTLNEGGTGTYTGLIDGERQGTLQLTWALETLEYVEVYEEGEPDVYPFEALVINASETLEGVTTYFRLTGVYIESHARQISLVLFSQEADSVEELDTADGEIYGDVWDIR